MKCWWFLICRRATCTTTSRTLEEVFCGLLEGSNPICNSHRISAILAIDDLTFRVYWGCYTVEQLHYAKQFEFTGGLTVRF